METLLPDIAKQHQEIGPQYANETVTPLTQSIYDFSWPITCEGMPNHKVYARRSP
jgi:hypothetical protein